MLNTENKYAIVGAGGVFPGACNLDEFWENLLAKRVFIRKLPDDSVERDVFFRPEVHNTPNKVDRSYTDIRASLGALEFDPQKFRIPPTVAAHMDDNQKLSLIATDQALASGGLQGVDNRRIGVFMGNTMVGQSHHNNLVRLDFEKFEHYLRRDPSFADAFSAEEKDRILVEIRNRTVVRQIRVTEDTAPGILPNIIAARINAVFDFHGHAYVVDAACASALAAIICGIQQLRLGECDAVICGAADVLNEEVGRIYFSGVGALSPDGSYPFDDRANGFVVGDGGGVVVLRRLEDAIRAGCKIWAVVTGYGQASDGRGKAIAAPNESWQAEVIRRAWEMAGSPVDTVELIEAHGTSTQVGDLSEINALKRSFLGLGATKTGYCGIGSVKSNIGHLKSAAGIAGFLKAILALDRKVLPPTAGFSRENPKLQLAGSPFYVLSEAKHWADSEFPRRAGVSAFGFGGADYHIALEEYRTSDYADSPPTRPLSTSSSAGEQPGSETPRLAGMVVVDSTSAEPLLFSAESEQGILQQLDSFDRALTKSTLGVHELVTLQNSTARASAPIRLGLTLRDARTFHDQTSTVRQWLGRPGDAKALSARGIALGKSDPISMSQIAVMFPGQGSQYPDMLVDVISRYPSAGGVMDRADILWKSLTGTGISEMIRSAKRGTSATDDLLRETRNTHPTVVFSSLATYRVLEDMGLTPGVMLGHSVGEFTALAAARRLSFSDAIQLVHARATSFSEVTFGETGAMAALPFGSEATRELLDEARSPLEVANINGPTQTIVSGAERDVDSLIEVCKSRGIRAIRLNVSHAFHSLLMTPAEIRFREALNTTQFGASSTRVIANASNEYYGPGSNDVQRELMTQITGSVRFADSIRKLYADGIRLFVEVGPSNVLGALTRTILADSDALVLSSDQKNGDHLDALVRLVGGLFVAGVPIDPAACLSVKHGTEPAPDVAAIQTTASARVQPISAPHKTPGVASPSDLLTMIPPLAKDEPRIVYGGVAVGLPGSYKQSFRDDNFEQLFNGNNLIERLADAEKQSLVDLHISKVVKSEQGASFASLSSLDEVIQLAGKIGRLDLASDYRIDEKDIANMSSSIAHAVAAGYEALRDAHIPLVHEYTRTAGGSMLPERWALPKEMQRHTAVIFANGFPMLEPIIREVSRHLAYRFGRKAREDLFEFYDTLILRIADRDSRKVVSDWYSLNCSRLGAVPGDDDVYAFNHHLMTQISMQANNRLARLINARGPNFQLNAACSSAATAVALAEDLIRGGRAKRVIVIGGDNPTSNETFPYLGAGFLSTGACTNEGDLYRAALPFDRRRNGMIMGAGAVGIVVELETECLQRGITPVCELLGTHTFNTAGHSSQLDVPRYAEELDSFVARMEARHGLDRRSMAKQLVYVSHETYTPPRGGCSESEAVALRHVFGEGIRDIEISNTKGMTGHTMGASIEDALAAKALQFGRAAPVVNFKEADPALEGLNLSRGESKDFEFALRMAAGFGSQGNYILLKRRAQLAERVADPVKHSSWLSSISALDRPELVHLGRLLVVKDAKPGSIVVDRPIVESNRRGPLDSVRVPPNRVPEIPPEVGASSSNCEAIVGNSSASSSPRVRADIEQLVFAAVAEVTGYPTSILNLDMELEADLGVDTVKQATILARLAEAVGISELGSIRLSEYPTLRSVAELYSQELGANGASEIPTSPSSNSVVRSPPDETELSPVPSLSHAPDGGIRHLVFGTIAEVTGYSADILEVEMELEADLGIDTVKQATILSIIAEKLGLAPDIGLRMSDFRTVGDLVSNLVQVGETAHHSSQATLAVRRTAPCMSREQVLDAVYTVMRNHTPYPPEMLDEPLRLSTDLDLDGETQQKLRLAFSQRFGCSSDWTMPEDPSIGELVDCFAKCVGTADLVGDEPEIQNHLHATISNHSQFLGRQVLALREAPLTQAQEPTFPPKHAWIIADDARQLELLASRLEGDGVSVSRVVMPKSGSPDELVSVLETLLEGPCPELVLDIAGEVSAASLHEQPPSVVIPAIHRAADCRFVLFKRLQAAKWYPARILAVVDLGGDYSLGKPASKANAAHGIHLGFYKSIRKEWRLSTKVTILDVPASSWAGGALEACQNIERELRGIGAGVEICYVDGIRHRVVALDSAFDDSAVEPLGPDEVVVASGGGSGITARMVLELAKRHACRFALIGRTRLDETAKGKRFVSDEQRAAEKLAIRHRLESEGKSVTPRSIEVEFVRTERSAEIFDTLDELTRLGSTARYLQADVCDPNAVQHAIDETTASLGPITMLIFGAGVEISHNVAQKTAEEFRAVHGPKTIGSYLLRWFCRHQPLRRTVAISSISSHLGSAGQLDYSAANAFLDVVARTETCPGIRSLSLAWSAWGQMGMAWRNSYVREQAEGMGLNFIEPETGAKAAVSEMLASGRPPEVIIHRGLGNVVDSEIADLDLEPWPMIDWIERRGPRISRAFRRFSPKRDVLLEQHRFAGVSLMPGVGFMEMMAEVAALERKSAAGAVVWNDVAFLDAFKLYRDEARDVAVQIEHEPEPSGLGMTVCSPLSISGGARTEVRSYARATVRITNDNPKPALQPDVQIDWSQQSDMRAHLRDAKDIRQNVQLGPLMNEASKEDSRLPTRVRWGTSGIETLMPAPTSCFENPKYPVHRLLANPALLDSLHQAGAILAILLTKHVYLPVGASEFVVYGSLVQRANYRVVAKLKRLEEQRAVYDMIMVREDGVLCASIANSTFLRVNS